LFLIIEVVFGQKEAGLLLSNRICRCSSSGSGFYLQSIMSPMCGSNTSEQADNTESLLKSGVQPAFLRPHSCKM